MPSVAPAWSTKGRLSPRLPVDLRDRRSDPRARRVECVRNASMASMASSAYPQHAIDARGNIQDAAPRRRRSFCLRLSSFFVAPPTAERLPRTFFRESFDKEGSQTPKFGTNVVKA